MHNRENRAKALSGENLKSRDFFHGESRASLDTIRDTIFWIAGSGSSILNVFHAAAFSFEGRATPIGCNVRLWKPDLYSLFIRQQYARWECRTFCLKSCQAVTGQGLPAGNGTRRRRAALHIPMILSSKQAKYVVCCLGVAVAIIDSFTPADVNPAIFYALAIGLCSWTRSARWLWTATVTFSFLTLITFRFGAPPTGLHFMWVDWTNRYLTVCTLFVVAAFVQMQMNADQALRAVQANLEIRVRERTSQLEQANAEILKQAELVRELSSRLLIVQDDERRRIARELHDGIGQSLAAVGMNIAFVRGEASRLSSPAQASIAENAQLVDDVQREIRTMSYLLHPPLLDEIGLRSALHWFTKGFSDRSKIKTTLDIPADLGRLPRELELCVFRVVQECLTNVHRHSGSGVADVSLARQNGALVVEVTDRGHGMNMDGAALVPTARRGVGIPGMQERLRHFGGTLEINSTAAGTSVRASIPVALQPQLEAERFKVAASSAG